MRDILPVEMSGYDTRAVEEAQLGCPPEPDVTVLVKVRVPLVAVNVEALKHR